LCEGDQGSPRGPQTALLLFLLALLRRFTRCSNSGTPRLPLIGGVYDASTVVPLGSVFFETVFFRPHSRYQSFDCPRNFGTLRSCEQKKIRVTTLQIINISMRAVTARLRRLAHRLKQQLAQSMVSTSRSLCIEPPNRAKRLSSHRYDPQFQLPCRAAIGKLDGRRMFSFFLPTQGAKRVANWQATFLLDAN